MKRGFTIMEIMVSVVIIAVVTLTIAKVNKQNINMVNYVNTRLKNELSNTLFLHPEVTKYDKSEKDAYELLKKMKIKNSKAKEYLKKIKREIYVQDVEINEIPVPVNLTAIMLKSKFSTRYYRLSL